MRRHQVRFLGLLSIPLVLALFTPSRAAADRDDPPSSVARLSKIEGSVSFEPAGTNDWVSAVVNRPMTTGDKLWTDRGSRAEMHLGSASVRLGSRTGFSFLNLSDNATQIRLAEGAIRVRVKQLYSRETFEVDTPNLAFSILRPGIYRFNVNEAGDVTAITVRNGEGEVTGGGQYFTVRAHETAIFSGADQLTADFREMYRDDDFDRWCFDRDGREDRSLSVRYVSPDVIGYEDLDDYGWWRPVPEYGQVWFPRVTVVGWAPYRYGHWVYIWPWGYTWVEDEPWGFAPFHYGRWVVVRGAWGWVPCPPAVVGIGYPRPVYAPALVAWVGGRHWGVSVSIGGGSNVGWFPLGPHEVYVPSYPVSRTYVQNVNITNTVVNTTVINNYYNTTVLREGNHNDNEGEHNDIRYVNRGVRGAVTVTSQDTLTTAQPVHSHMVRVNEGELENTRVAVTAPQLTPEKQAVLGSGHHVDARPPDEVMERRVVARTAPPSPSPTFEEQHANLQENGGRIVPLSHMRRAQFEDGESAGVRIAPGTRPAPTTQGNSNSWGNQTYVNPGDRADRGGNQPGDVDNGRAPAGDRGERANHPLPRNVPTRSYGDRPPEARAPIQETRQPDIQRGQDQPQSNSDRRRAYDEQSQPQPQVNQPRQQQDQGRPRYDQPATSNSDRRRAYDEQSQPQPQVNQPRQPQDQGPARNNQPPSNSDRHRAYEDQPQPQVNQPRQQQDQGRPGYNQQPPSNSDRRRAYEDQPQPQADRPRQQEPDRPRYEQPRQQERPPERPQPQAQERPMPQPQHERPAPEPQRERPVERPQPQAQERPMPQPQHERPAPEPQRERPVERPQPQPQERPAPQPQHERPVERPQPQAQPQPQPQPQAHPQQQERGDSRQQQGGRNRDQ